MDEKVQVLLMYFYLGTEQHLISQNPYSSVGAALGLRRTGRSWNRKFCEEPRAGRSNFKSVYKDPDINYLQPTQTIVCFYRSTASQV